MRGRASACVCDRAELCACVKTRSAGDPRSQTEAFRISSVGEKERVGQTEAAQRGRECNSHSDGSKGDLSPKPRENRVNPVRFGGLSWLDDIRGLRIQPSLRSRRLERTARAKRHRVLFQRLPRHRPLNFGASRPVINRGTVGLIGKWILIVPEPLILFGRARNEVRNTSELRMTAAQSGDARDREQTSAEDRHAVRFLDWRSLGLSFL